MPRIVSGCRKWQEGPSKVSRVWLDSSTQAGLEHSLKRSDVRRCKQAEANTSLLISEKSFKC